VWKRQSSVSVQGVLLLHLVFATDCRALQVFEDCLEMVLIDDHQDLDLIDVIWLDQMFATCRLSEYLLWYFHNHPLPLFFTLVG